MIINFPSVDFHTARNAFSYDDLTAESQLLVLGNEEQIVITKGIEKAFFEVLYRVYKPFLSRGHLEDRHQFSIWVDKALVGFIQVSSAKAHFLQVALIPSFRQSGIAKTSILAVVEMLGYQRIGWIADKANYPSLKLLYKLGGGITPGAMIKHYKNAEGGFTIHRSMHKNMRENLESFLPESRELFASWTSDFDARHKERNAVREYVKGITLKANL